MLDKMPNMDDMTALIGQSLYDVWQKLCAAIDEKYDMDCIWNSGGKAWTYEYKYRRGGKTLCALYARENCVGFMVILGKDERVKFESVRSEYSDSVQKVYDDSKTYHDGKWLMFEPVDTSLFGDFMQLLAIKRRPNRKQKVVEAKMAKKIDPKQTKRAMAFGLQMNAPNPSPNKAYEIPLSDIQKQELSHRGVPDVFVTDIQNNFLI